MRRTAGISRPAATCATSSGRSPR
ncbi:hypothetical protein RB2654_15105 [Rhodobacterales bacterium HTCC2654]|uniref:Uncharacterized protein n=1 Tax=Maritimibacter alkaliphilus HTCC2654 TaxID=314271 RepID=A3VH70_9RHOB|nr:hypothetical protein RB2654_15105 [Rhodobacterales bacterium HTCC2654] [Maritimibacter alkaliphilus HTCC2654]